MADDDTTPPESSEATPIAPPDAAQEPSTSASEHPESSTAQIPVNEPLPSQPAQANASSPAAVDRDRLVVARATIQERKHKKRDKIMTEIEKLGKITNDQVEKLLHVSDATATRYLSELEKEGKIKQVGKIGHAVEYTKV